MSSSVGFDSTIDRMIQCLQDHNGKSKSTQLKDAIGKRLSDSTLIYEHDVEQATDNLVAKKKNLLVLKRLNKL